VQEIKISELNRQVPDHFIASKYIQTEKEMQSTSAFHKLFLTKKYNSKIPVNAM
jgi:hypothetical protein